MFLGHTRYIWTHTRQEQLRWTQVLFDLLCMGGMTGRLSSPAHDVPVRRHGLLQRDPEPEEQRRADRADLLQPSRTEEELQEDAADQADQGLHDPPVQQLPAAGLRRADRAAAPRDQRGLLPELRGRAAL